MKQGNRSFYVSPDGREEAQVFDIPTTDPVYHIASGLCVTLLLRYSGPAAVAALWKDVEGQ